MSILQTLVIVADVGLISWLVWLAFEGGMRGGELVFTLTLLFLIVLNLYFVIYGKRGDDGWIGLLLKRKALEEKRKIKELEK